MFEGIAGLTPTLPPVGLWTRSFLVTTPTTFPRASSNGLPELPPLIAASVWIESASRELFSGFSFRSSALMMPLVTVSSSPNGY